MKDGRIDIVKLFNTKRRGSLQNSLCTVILVMGVDIFKIHRMRTYSYIHFYAAVLQVSNKMHFTCCKRGNQAILYIHIADGIGEIKRSATRHKSFSKGCYHFV